MSAWPPSTRAASRSSADLPVPPFKLTVCQIVIASADLLVAAWVLHMLMPRMPGIDYPKFVGIYMVAYVAVVLSHVPGGLGVLEPAILLFLPTTTAWRVRGA